MNNFNIIQLIQINLITIISEQIDKNILKQKIIIYSKENFDKIIEKIKNKLLEQEFIKRGKSKIIFFLPSRLLQN